MKQLMQELTSLLSDEPDRIATMANAASFLFNSLPDINWAGFYLEKEGILVVGPFCGRPACTRIHPGRGVCGTAYSERRTLVVPDVHRFEGHIACDAASASEMVIPLFGNDGNPFGVLDLDSPVPNRFDAETAAFLSEAARLIERLLNSGK